MEFPHIGAHCSEKSCNKLDFLPVKCDACREIFCQEHMSYEGHDCDKGRLRDFQVPVCPLCNQPVPSKRGEAPDVAVGAHIDRDCNSDPAKDRRLVFANKCMMRGCKKKEIVPVLCAECGLNFCIKHRFTDDHKCQGKKAGIRQRALEAAKFRQQQKNSPNARQVDVNSIQGTLSEDEAMARALALSLEDALPNNHTTRHFQRSNNHQSSSTNAQNCSVS